MRRAMILLPLLGISAALCVASGLDRQVQQTTRVGEAPYWLSIGPRSDRQRVFRAMSRGDTADARTRAAAALRKAPLEPANLSLFGSMMLLARHDATARRAMTLSASLGWRDPATQSYWLDQARTANDFILGARHADALLRIGQATDKARDMLVDLETVPPGRDAVANRLAVNPSWRQQYFADLRDYPPDLAANRVRTVTLATRRGMQPDCELSGLAAQGLLRQGILVPAAALWYTFCDRTARPTRGINDGGFEREPAGRYPSPFRWRLLSAGAVDVAIVPAAAPMHSRALSYRSSSSADETIARQTILLPPGAYRVTWLESGHPDGRNVSPQFSCLANSRRLDVTVGRSDRSEGKTGTFLVPPDGCAAQTVSITVPPASDGIVDDLFVEPLAH